MQVSDSMYTYARNNPPGLSLTTVARPENKRSQRSCKGAVGEGSGTPKGAVWELPGVKIWGIVLRRRSEAK